MKYCPTCNVKYDEDVLRFCMKDGTPLLEVEEPKFIAMPSESLEASEADDPGEVTVIRRNVAVPTPLPEEFDEADFPSEQPNAQRIVVPTTPELFAPQPGATRVIPPQPTEKPNTFKIVLLTMLGTLALLAVGAMGLWMLQRDSSAANSNANGNSGNLDMNVNANALDGNFDFNGLSSSNGNSNSNSNANSVSNANANSKLTSPTPTPTPKPSPTATPTPVVAPTDDDDDGTDDNNVSNRPRPTPIPVRTPIPTPTPIIIRPGGPTPVPRMRTQPTNRPSIDN